jgi:hypothetical protein
LALTPRPRQSDTNRNDSSNNNSTHCDEQGHRKE